MTEDVMVVGVLQLNEEPEWLNEDDLGELVSSRVGYLFCSTLLVKEKGGDKRNQNSEMDVKIRLNK